MHGCIELSMGNQSQIAIVGALFLLLLWTVLVVYPNIDVDAPLRIIFIFELNLESSVSEPLDVHLTLHRLVSQWFLI